MEAECVLLRELAANEEVRQRRSFLRSPRTDPCTSWLVVCTVFALFYLKVCAACCPETQVLLHGLTSLGVCLVRLEPGAREGDVGPVGGPVFPKLVYPAHSTRASPWSLQVESININIVQVFVCRWW